MSYKESKWTQMTLNEWRRGVEVITTAQFRSTMSELGFFTSSNPARGVSKNCECENLWQWPRLKIRRKRLSLVNHSAKTTHHHHHHHHHHHEPKCVEMCLNKLKGAWMSLNELNKAWINLIEFKWSLISLIELEWAQISLNESKLA